MGLDHPWILISLGVLNPIPYDAKDNYAHLFGWSFHFLGSSPVCFLLSAKYQRKKQILSAISGLTSVDGHYAHQKDPKFSLCRGPFAACCKCSLEFYLDPEPKTSKSQQKSNFALKLYSRF